MCPRRQHLQVLTLAFCHNFDPAAGDIAHPSGKCQIFRLVVRRESKANPLHPPADDQMQPRAPRFVLSSQPSPARTDSRHFSSSTLTPKSWAFFSFEPGSAPATTKSVLRLTDEVTRPPAAIILRSASSRVIDSSVPVSTNVLSRNAPRPSTSAGVSTSRI